MKINKDIAQIAELRQTMVELLKPVADVASQLELSWEGERFNGYPVCRVDQIIRILDEFKSSGGNNALETEDQIDHGLARLRVISLKGEITPGGEDRLSLRGGGVKSDFSASPAAPFAGDGGLYYRGEWGRILHIRVTVEEKIVPSRKRHDAVFPYLEEVEMYHPAD